MSIGTRSVLACGVAGIAVGLAVWQINSFVRGPDDIRSAESVAASRTIDRGQAGAEVSEAPGPSDLDAVPGTQDDSVPAALRTGITQNDPMGEDTEREFAFEPIDALALSDQLVDAANEEPALGALGQAGKLSLADTWRRFVSPLVAGDRALFIGATTSLGAVTPEGGPNNESAPAGGVFDRLQPLLRDARFDLDSAITRAADPSDAGAVPSMPSLPPAVAASLAGRSLPVAPMLMTSNQVTDDQGQTSTVQRLDIPLSGMFPAARDLMESGAPVVEVWAPTQLPDADEDIADMGMSTFFVNNRADNAWQPVGLRLRLLSEASQSRMRAALTD